MNDPQIQLSQSQTTPNIILENNEQPMDNTEEVPTLVETQQKRTEMHCLNPPDDLHLCSAWLHVIKDPVVRTD